MSRFTALAMAALAWAAAAPRPSPHGDSAANQATATSIDSVSAPDTGGDGAGTSAMHAASADNNANHSRSVRTFIKASMRHAPHARDAPQGHLRANAVRATIRPRVRSPAFPCECAPRIREVSHRTMRPPGASGAALCCARL